MDRLEKHVVVIPCLNEEKTIGSLVRSIRCHIRNVVVVDDGSTDDTARLAAAAGAEIVVHPRNLGKGAAVKSGLIAAMQRGFDRALLMDGDGQHQTSDIPAFVHTAGVTKAALVIGDRLHDAMSIPWLRRQVNRWMSRQISRRAGRHLPDTQCGFRLVDLKAWAALSCQTRRFEIESEMLLAFLEAGCRVEFIPIQVIGRGAHSHINPLSDAWRWCKWWCTLPAGRGIAAILPMNQIGTPGEGTRPTKGRFCSGVGRVPSPGGGIGGGDRAIMRIAGGIDDSLAIRRGLE